MRFAPERVRIEIVVHNRGTARSHAATMVVQSAPLGAFLPWRPLGRLMVPPVEPESSVPLQMDVDRTLSAPLGEFSRVPPARLLTALSAGDADDAGAGRGGTRVGRTRWLSNSGAFGLIGRPAGILAPDIFELLGHRTVRWAGNINVFIGQRSVERRMANTLRIYPGRKNLAYFLVGTGRDTYAFDLEGIPLTEYASLVGGTGIGALAFGPHEGQAVPMGEWVEATGPLVVGLSLCPPPSCQEVGLTVHVRQRATGREASVEFSLDARAAGPGCFTV